MSDVYITGVQVLLLKILLRNDEIVSSFNSYVDNFNNHNKNDIRERKY